MVVLLEEYTYSKGIFDLDNLIFKIRKIADPTAMITPVKK